MSRNMAQTFCHRKTKLFLLCQRVYSTERHYEHCKILGVSCNASKKEIRDAFVKRSKELHPDLSGQRNHDEFIKLTEAYNTLIKVEEPIQQPKSGKTVNSETYRTRYNPYSENVYKQFHNYYDRSDVRARISEHMQWTDEQLQPFYRQLPIPIIVIGLLILLISAIYQRSLVNEEVTKSRRGVSNNRRIITIRD